MKKPIYIDISYKGKIQHAYGRNGTLTQSGLTICLQHNRIALYPITSRGFSTSCSLDIPNDPEIIQEVIDCLQKQKEYLHSSSKKD